MPWISAGAKSPGSLNRATTGQSRRTRSARGPRLVSVMPSGRKRSSSRIWPNDRFAPSARRTISAMIECATATE